MTDKQRYWVSWWSGYYGDEGCSKPPFQCLETGERDRSDGRTEVSLCSVIDATSEDEIRTVLIKHFPDCEMRFCELRERDFIPSSGRFPGFENKTQLADEATHD